MTYTKYWIWFTQAIGYCTPKAKQVAQMYNSILEFYEGGEAEWRFSGLFSNAEIEKLSFTKLSSADEILFKCNMLGYRILSLDNSFYPECLKNIDDPPAVIYVSGHIPEDIDNRLSIGIVGTRRASRYGMKAAFDFGYNLAKIGVAVISGGALGIDSSSHNGALSADGVTICVLGCGINYNYLRDNAQMRSSITFKGAVISEYPPDTEPYPFHFPQRNRIISALSNGILVIEAGRKSGSLITVNRALEQNSRKKIFALAGPADPHFFGTNELIKEKVAVLVTDYKDIINEFDSLYVTSELPAGAAPDEDAVDVIPIKGKPPENINGLRTKDLSEVPVHRENLNLTDDESTVYYAISDEPIHIDAIAEKTGLPVFRLLPVLTTLELRQLIKCVQGRSYRLI